MVSQETEANEVSKESKCQRLSSFDLLFKCRQLSSSGFPTAARQAIADGVNHDVAAFIEFAVEYMCKQELSCHDLNRITIPDLAWEHSCACKPFFTNKCTALEDLRPSARSGSAEFVLNTNICFNSHTMTEILEMMPYLSQASEFCFQHLKESEMQMKREDLIAAIESG